MPVEAPELNTARVDFVCPAVASYSRVHNYSADAGAGSQIITNISESPRWRAALLGTVAAGSLWLYSARAARADCAADGTTLNCTGTIAGNVAPGVVDGGILVDGDNYDTLNVYELDADITPAAGVDGINFHRNAGDITIVSNTTPYAIYVLGPSADGIDAMAPGAISIDHTGNITSEDGRGISAQSTEGPVEITLDGTIDAADEGIFASGVGGITITTYTGNTVTGGSKGIAAYNSGGGAVEITANGHVEATAANGIGVYAYNGAAGDELTVTTDSVTAGDLGILARNYGTGDTTITTNGAVTGGDYGIYAEHFGADGALVIYANGDVEGTGDTGIFARSYGVDAFDNSLRIETEGLVTGGNFGIRAFNYGDGALEIVANGDVGDPDGIVPSLAGIDARNGAVGDPAGTDLFITANANVTGEYGIVAFNYGTGLLSIFAAGDVSAGTTGIYAVSYGADADDVSLYIYTPIGAGTVSGGDNGIVALNYGSGALGIVTHGVVEGTGDTGIYALNYGTDLSIETEAVTGGILGIEARNYGNAALDIVANGDVEGTSNIGIYARNNGTGLSIETEAVTGGILGIEARNYGNAALDIVANGDVEGTGAPASLR